jgi:hypothetical protein
VGALGARVLTRPTTPIGAPMEDRPIFAPFDPRGVMQGLVTTVECAASGPTNQEHVHDPQLDDELGKPDVHRVERPDHGGTTFTTRRIAAPDDVEPSMIRLVATAVVSLLANAVALIVGALVLDDMALGVGGFVLAVALFTGTAVLVEPLTRQMALKNAPALIGSTALVATIVSLVVTALLTDSLQISGLATWVLATVIVWAVGVAARLLLPLVIFKKTLARRNQAAGLP